MRVLLDGRFTDGHEVRDGPRHRVDGAMGSAPQFSLSKREK